MSIKARWVATKAIWNPKTQVREVEANPPPVGDSEPATDHTGRSLLTFTMADCLDYQQTLNTVTDVALRIRQRLLEADLDKEIVDATTTNLIEHASMAWADGEELT